jgi:glutaryl-CoA dehydrogenase
MRVPDSYRLPEATSLRAPLLCLAEARYGIIFGTVGAARDCFEVSLAYATTRKQFDGPISKHQLTQAKFSDMATKITTWLTLKIQTKYSQSRSAWVSFIMLALH